MKTPAASWFAVLSVCVATACSHSDPFPTNPTLDDGPLNQVEPIRLTYSPGDDGWPVISPDGQWLSYRFARGTTDRDFCAGVLPATGGQRVAEVCAWEGDDLARSDDFRAMVLLGGGRMAFTWHASGTGNQAPQEAGLYLGEVGRERDATKVLDLLGRPAGASAVWNYLIDPVWLGENELVTLASKMFIGQPVTFGPVDTVYQGVEIARIDLGSTPAAVTPLTPAPDAVGWAIDQAAGRLYYHRRYYSAPPGSGAFHVVADSIFRVPLTGGAAEAVYGRAPGPGVLEEGIGGFALLNGRLFVTANRYFVPPPTPGDLNPLPVTQSDLLEILGDGTAEAIASMIGTAGNRWTRIAAGSHHLVVASELAGQKDLHLFEVDP